jgi:hypothetical protein
MKLNVTREMQKKCIFDMSKFIPGGTSNHNKHKNRIRRTKAALKAAWVRELNNQFNQECGEL